MLITTIAFCECLQQTFLSCSHFSQNCWTSTDASIDTNQVYATVDSKRIEMLNVSATLKKPHLYTFHSLHLYLQAVYW